MIFRLSHFGVLVSLLISLLLPSLSGALETAKLITYGPDSQLRKGDDDFRQVIYFGISLLQGDSIYVRLFDADISGVNDALVGNIWNSTTRFRLYGGAGVMSADGATLHTPPQHGFTSGTLLAEIETGINPIYDNLWVNLGAVSAKQGEPIGSYSYFKVTVEGLTGDDGNTFDVAISERPDQNLHPEEYNFFTTAATVRLPRNGIFAELRFRYDTPPHSVWIDDDDEEHVIIKDREIVVHNFDLAGAPLSVETRLRSGIKLVSSKLGSWAETDVILKEDDSDVCALRFEGGMEMPNDASFYIESKDGKPIPILLPIHIFRPNHRPEPKVNVIDIGGNTMLFDATETRDADNDFLSYQWDLGSGDNNKLAARVTHEYPRSGKYTAWLTVSDNSGQVGCATKVPVSFVINAFPQPDAGPSHIAAPNERITFDGSKSFDPDGSIIFYQWDFGDGERSEGAIVKHAYKSSGKYQVILLVKDDSHGLYPFNRAATEVWINAPPVVEIGPDLITSIDEPVFLSGSNHRDSDGNIVEFHWTFGDGSEADGMEVSHSWNKSGFYTVVAKLTDNAGVSNSYCLDTLHVFVNQPPVANAGRDWRVATDEPIIFDGSNSSDLDGKLIDCYWDFGDGSHANGSRVSHSYSSLGTYWAILKIQDDSRSSTDTDIDSALVIINYPPVPSAEPDR